MTLYLKAEIIKVPKGLFMTQQSYALQVIRHFGHEECQSISTPLVEWVKLTLDMNAENVDPMYYRSIVGNTIRTFQTRCFILSWNCQSIYNETTSTISKSSQKNLEIHHENIRLWNSPQQKFNNNTIKVCGH